jgi:hypothetical protein
MKHIVSGRKIARNSCLCGSKQVGLLLFALGIRTGCDVNFQFLYKKKSLLHWVTLDCNGLQWIALGYTGLHWIALDCTGLQWIAMGYWVALGCTGGFFYMSRLHWVVTSFLWVE